LFVNDGLLVDGFYRNVVVDNLVNGKPLVYLEGVSHQSVGDAGQVILINCEYIQVEDLNLSQADVGIILWNTNNTLMSGNNITNNVYGILLQSSSNNTITGNDITNSYSYGIWLAGPSNYNNSMSGNNITNSYVFDGILLDGSSGNTITGNSITNNGYFGIHVHGSSNNIISGNSITANKRDGIWLSYSSSNTISGNNITNNSNGVSLSYSSNNNFIFHNSFIDNAKQGLLSESYNNVWDDGYPSGGNYWSDYDGIDLCSGPQQKETGSDGIGDTPCVIDEYNQDNYPLMKPYPWDPHDVGITSVTTSKTIVGQGFNVFINASVFNYGDSTENINVTIYANQTIIGEIYNIDLTSRNSTTIAFTWNTSGFSRAYTISANATILPGEIDIADNTRTNGIVKVSCIGDLNGDYVTDGQDYQIVKNAIPSMPELPKWNPNADLNDDGVVDGQDFQTVKNNIGQSAP